MRDFAGKATFADAGSDSHCILQLFPMSSAYWSEMNFRRFSTSNRRCFTLFILDFIASTSSDESAVSLSSSSIVAEKKEMEKERKSHRLKTNASI